MILTKEKLEKQTLYFYPDDFDVTNWSNVSAAFDEMEHKQIETPRDLLSLLYQSNELLSMLSEAYSVLYFRSLADSEDNETSELLQKLTQNVLIPAQTRNAVILKKYYEHPLRNKLSKENYRQINQFFESVELKNFEIENSQAVEISSIITEYRQVYNQVRVEIEGKDYPLNIISHLLKKAEPEHRESIWRARQQCCIKHKQQFEDILDRLIKSRNKLANDAGFSNFYEYILMSNLYGKMRISDIQEIHTAISEVVLPFVRSFIKQRQKRLNIKNLRPWDLEADPETSSLTPFKTTEELVDKAITILYDIRFEYGILLNKMHNTGLLDLDYHQNKTQGEFFSVSPLWKSGRIIMNCTGQHRDMTMFFHEMGHILQCSAMFRNPLFQYIITPIQTRELASQTIVYLSTVGWDLFYPDKQDLKTAFRSLYEDDMMQLLHWSVMNQFELVLYSHPEWSGEQREKAMLSLCQKYEIGVDWKGLEDWQSIRWIQEFTLFAIPQYSFLSALSVFNSWQLLKNYRHDAMDTISRFQKFLEKSTDFTTDEVFHELDIKQDYSEKNMRKMIDFIQDEYKRIGK